MPEKLKLINTQLKGGARMVKLSSNTHKGTYGHAGHSKHSEGESGRAYVALAGVAFGIHCTFM